MAGDVPDRNIEAARLNCDAIVAALVGEVRELDVAGVHRVEAVGVLDPVVPSRSFRGSGVDVNVLEDQVGGVHDVDCPELWLHDVKVSNRHITNIPELERNRSSRPCSAHSLIPSFIVVPYLSISMDPACTVAVDTDVLSRKHESRSMILEFDVVVVMAPVFDVLGEEPFAVPFDVHVVDDRAEFGVDVVGVVCWEYDVAAMAASLKGLKDSGDVICDIAGTWRHGTDWAAVFGRV